MLIGVDFSADTLGSVTAGATAEIENQCRGTCAFLSNTTPKQIRANITDCRIAPESPARSVSQWAESIELLDQNAVGSRRFFRESKNDI